MKKLFFFICALCVFGLTSCHDEELIDPIDKTPYSIQVINNSNSENIDTDPIKNYEDEDETKKN